MKKTRLISLLLTAALALSSMPIMVSAAIPVNQKIDVLADATITEGDVTDVTDLTIGSGNKYLHVYRTTGNHGFSYTPSTAMEAGKTYYIEFDARNAVENDIVAGVENQFRMRAGLNASGAAHWATKAATNPDPVNQPDLVADGAIKGDVNSFGEKADFKHIAFIRNGWIHYTLAITADASSVGLWFYGGATVDAAGSVGDIQIDNFRFYEAGTAGVTIDFEDGTAPGFYYRHHVSDPAQIPAPTVVESADYTKAASGAVTYVIDQDIAGGACIFTGEVRYGVYHTDAALSIPNKADVTLIAVVDGREWPIASARDVEDWTDLSTVAQLPAGHLSEIKLVSEDAADLDSAIHLKNFSFKVPVMTVEEEDKGQMPNIGVVMVLLAKKRAAAEGDTTSVFTVNGAALNTKNVKAVEGNKYLEVSERSTSTTGIKLVTVPAAGNYTLEFDIRSSVDLEIVKDAGIDFNTDTAGDVIRIRTASDTTVFTDFEKDDWKTFSYGFAADGQNAVSVEIYGGYYKTQCMPFDIDNIVIKDANGVVIYTENFDALEVEDFGTSISLSGTTTADNAVSIVPRGGAGNTASYAIIAEDAYVSAKVADNAVVSYNAEALAAGNYVAKGYIRNSYFNANGSEKSDADAAINSTDYLSWFAADTTFTYNGEEVAALAGMINFNKNQFALKVSVGAETASYKVTSRWTAFEVPFTVAEGDAAPVVNFEIDHDMPYTMGDKELVPFDLKVEIVPAQ